MILRGEAAEPDPSGNLFLTNIHQLYESRDEEWTPQNAIEALLGKKPAKDLAASGQRSMLERVKSLKDLIVLNDEAHHVHDEDLAWSQSLLAIHRALPKGLALWLDFSATPKDQNGMYFPWTVCDYPLAQAVEDRIVKAPLIVTKEDDPSSPRTTPRASPRTTSARSTATGCGRRCNAGRSTTRSTSSSIRGRCSSSWPRRTSTPTRSASTCGRPRSSASRRPRCWSSTPTPRARSRKKDLDKAREAARDIDKAESKVKVIVSVMMLREGWDVRNVTVVLGLRPFTAKAEILPEQVIGRGLRLMPRRARTGTQTLEVMGTRAFEDFVKQLETEGLALPVSKKPPSLPIIIEPIKERARFDIAIPLTRPLFEHSMVKLGELTPEALGTLASMNDVVIGEQLQFVLAFMTTGSTIGEISVDYPVELPQVSIGRLTELVLRKAQIPGRFAELYPILERYLTEFAFGRRVDLEERTVQVALSNFVLRGRLANEIARRVSELTVEERPVEFEEQEFRLANIAPFAWRRQHVQLERTIFNFVAVYNDYEKRFAEFLASRPDIDRWAALAEQFTRFHVTYLSANGALKRYYPDFLAVQNVDGREVSWILETKGRVWRDTEYKDKGIKTWCHALHEQTGSDWRYRRVDQLVFDKGQFATFEDLIIAVDSPTPGLFAGVALVPAAVPVASETLLRRVIERLDGAGWLTEPVAGAMDPPLVRAVDTADAGYVICVFEGQREVSRSEVEALTNLRSSSDDATWRWIAISEAGFSAEARSVARDHELDLRTEPEFDPVLIAQP